MPKTANPQTPGTILQSFIDKYQINPFRLSKDVKLSCQTIQNILKGKGKITVPTAVKLGQYFGNSPRYWIDVQATSEINELSEDKKFLSVIKSIPKAEKPAGKIKTKTETRVGKNKTDTLAEKRKKAAKVPGAKRARGKK